MKTALAQMYGKGTINIMLIDPDPTAHETVKALIRSSGNNWNLNTAFDVDETLQTMGEVVPDIILMDFGKPGDCNIEHMRKLKSRVPSVPILLFTGVPHASLLRQAVAAGACGCLVKPTTSKVLVNTIVQAVQGWPVLCPQALKNVLAHPKFAEPHSSQLRMTKRQRQILALFSKDLSDKEIAMELNIAPSTVHWHAAKIFVILGVHTREQAVHKYFGGCGDTHKNQTFL